MPARRPASGCGSSTRVRLMVRSWLITSLVTAVADSPRLSVPHPALAVKALKPRSFRIYDSTRPALLIAPRLLLAVVSLGTMPSSRPCYGLGDTLLPTTELPLGGNGIGRNSQLKVSSHERHEQPAGKFPVEFSAGSH